MFGALDISTSALVAQRIRMDAVANNMANAQTVNGVNQPYQRRVPVFAEGYAVNQPDKPGVHVAEIAVDTRPGTMVFDPDHPYADAEGYVQMPNVSELNEMINGMMAARAYDANITVMNVTRSMFDSTMRLIA